MNYATILQVVARYGKQAGPQVRKAWKVVGPILVSSPQGKKMAEQFSQQMSKRKDNIQAQVDLAKQYAAEAMTEQAAADRHEMARAWAQRAKVLEMSLKTTENMPRKAAKPKRVSIAASVDELLGEMIETMSKWSVAGELSGPDTF